MARLNAWIGATLGGCVVIALGYLPPRGSQPSRGSFFVTQLSTLTPAHRRAQELAEQWRAADASLRLLEERQVMKWDSSRIGPTIRFRGATPPDSTVRRIEALADTLWRDLGLGETKIRVGVVIAMENAHVPARKAGPIPQQEGEAYLVPDSTDRTSCLALLPANHFWSAALTGQAEALRLRPGQLGQWLQAGIGPCAFYAMYGTPGWPVRSWLAARNWDLALYLGTNGVGGERFSSADLMAEPRYSWYWDAIYMRSPSTVACFAGRTSGCRAAVLAGADADELRSMPVPQVIRPERRWWRKETLIPGERFLGDVAREVGRERFQTFWISSLPVDTALSAALKQPIGTWTRQWQRRFVAPIRLGATAPVGATAVALLLAAVAVSAVALAASRRQVR